MSKHVEIPHFTLPFRFNAYGRAEVAEQDSQDEIMACIRAVLLCPYGFRHELPEFGTKDQTFRGQIDVNEIATTLEIWESRGELLIEQGAGSNIGELIEEVTVTVRGGSS